MDSEVVPPVVPARSRKVLDCNLANRRSIQTLWRQTDHDLDRVRGGREGRRLVRRMLLKSNLPLFCRIYLPLFCRACRAAATVEKISKFRHVMSVQVLHRTERLPAQVVSLHSSM